MSDDIPIVYRDDTDATLVWDVTSKLATNVDWLNPEIAVGSAAYAPATWLGTPAPVRQIRLDMPLALGLSPGAHGAYLRVPASADIMLGTVYVADRT